MRKLNKRRDSLRYEESGSSGGEDRYYRIRMGDYRLGIIVEGEVVTFVRFLHRRDIYGYFP